jgi:hypothetical protein
VFTARYAQSLYKTDYVSSLKGYSCYRTALCGRLREAHYTYICTRRRVRIIMLVGTSTRKQCVTRYAGRTGIVFHCPHSAKLDGIGSENMMHVYRRGEKRGGGGN